MTNLIGRHVEECRQVRGQRRKLTKALIVISTLTPVSGDSRNLPLIVLEALKDILCDFREARTRRQAWRPIQASSYELVNPLRRQPTRVAVLHRLHARTRRPSASALAC